MEEPERIVEVLSAYFGGEETQVETTLKGRKLMVDGRTDARTDRSGALYFEPFLG